jgi:flagellar basal-body rod protein FlgB
MADSFKILEGLLRFAGRRHGVITSNIANIDTPGYRTKDMEFKTILDNSIIELKVTQPGHINPAGEALDFKEIEEDTGQWKDRNNVELDREMAKLTENALFFEASLTMLSTKIRMFRNALRRQ